MNNAPNVKANAAYVTLDLVFHNNAESKVVKSSYFVNVVFETAKVSDIDISEVYSVATEAVNNQLRTSEAMKDVTHYSINPKYVAFYFEPLQSKYHVTSISDSIKVISDDE